MQLIEFKGSSISVIKLILRTGDVHLLQTALAEKLSHNPHFFCNEPTILDLKELDGCTEPIDWPGILSLLREYKLCPVAFSSVPEQFVSWVEETQLLLLQEDSFFDFSKVYKIDAVGAVDAVDAVDPVNHLLVPEYPCSVVVEKPLRSGQRVYAQKADLIVLAMVSSGAEVISDHNVHVYAPLRGRVLAGAEGDVCARVFTTCFEAELVSIAGIYSTFEKGLPSHFRGKPVKISLQRVDQDAYTLCLNDLHLS